MQDASSFTTPFSESPGDVAALRALVAAQHAELARREAELAQRAAQVADLQALLVTQQSAVHALVQERDELRTELDAFREWCKRLRRDRFGRTSERDDPRQRLLQFPDLPEVAEAYQEAVDDAVDAALQALADKGATKAKKRRKKLRAGGEFPAHWPRDVETIEPPEQDRVCDTHGPKVLIGHDETQTMVLTPPQLRVRVRRFAKYACAKQPECGVTQPPRPPSLVEGDRFDVTVAAHVIAMKYHYHLSLYREQDLFAAMGWTPSRSTLANLLEASSDLCVPLVDFLRRQALAGGLVGCDDTHVTLITPPFVPSLDLQNPRAARMHEVLSDAIAKKEPSVTARMWAYRSLTAPLNYFDFTVSRHRDGPAEVLADYRGTLLGDCYAGFEALVLASDARITRAACWAHARRKFKDLDTLYPLEAAQMLALVQRLYDLEDQARALTPDERLALRLRESQPMVEKIRAFLHGPLYEHALPAGKLRAAMNYVRNNWNELLTFLTDGRCPLDNNDTEQLMRQVAIGRKNWLFMGSVAGGERAARLMTLVSSALRNDLDVERYLADVLRKLLDGCVDYESLLPHVWRQSHPDAVRTYREEERRDALDRQTARRADRREHHPCTGELTPQQKAQIIVKARAKLLGEAKSADSGGPSAPASGV